MPEKKQRVRLSLVLAMAVAIIFGFVAGVVGELCINSFLMPEVQTRNLGDLTRRIEELTSQRDKVFKDLLSEQDFSINEVVEKVQPAVVDFYLYKKSAAVLSGVYLDNEILGSGFVLTADGWLVTSSQVITSEKNNYVARINSGVYPVEQIIFDDITDVVFVKIAKNNLPFVELDTKNTLNFGQTVLVVSGSRGVERTTVNDLFFAKTETAADLLRSSEEYYRFLKLNHVFDESGLGAPVINLQGKVLGIVISEDGQVLPTDYFTSIMKTAVQKNETPRNYLGVNYLDLELAANYDVEQKKGALLLGDNTRLAVVKDSPAQAAGLQAGDIITKVENEEVNQYHSLTELIQDYQIESAVNLTVIRGGEEKSVSVELEKIQE